MKESKQKRLERLADSWLAFKAKHKSEPRPETPKPIKGKSHASLLPRFWQRFNSLRTVEGKLVLLKEMAKLEIYNPVPYKVRRGHKHSRRKRTWKCRVCAEKASHIHHIIQVQNGGRNKKSNLIELCESCHEAIHPWMVQDITPPRMNETMERVARD